MNKKTHFGFQSVPWDEKQKKVAAVFHSVAQQYDFMNDLMSFGIHRIWKRKLLSLSHVRAGHTVLDLAGGTGDVARLLYKKIGSTGTIVLADINESMLQLGRDRLMNEGIVKPVHYVQANAEQLPFPNNTFDAITIAFGLRNVTDKLKALKSMHDVCKPGGALYILEFSKPTHASLSTLYDWYSFNILPKLGQKFAQDAESYQYLAESIRMHPPQTELKTWIEEAGFDECHYHNMTGGIVALHIAHKY